ncbi:hypothetical protein METBIDRAFT_10747 [Metschnikowia bicuspidata var. bicuspidata NRRL YB-4993]|uniref:Flavodoxin-like domain-containing protein n=1 Tax=Metschnikowia bicuspidata var. bicuspidata NRRL YB-4993 TaxID=869754 RepID=A0A1A0HCT9_9ASCO|nr:hypothetical protein METBIDRAFT_10747 [Metschnikowia bicuspidata var. bicuspidata NRRL YB-4993]OBA21821.1 hypothetical protein METBIDRAFT_10747 [Metschnikowia bicuspidata var. bicuspidata NRRL YB-4993]
MKVAILYYSTYGHIVSMAEAVKIGVEESSKASEVTIFLVPETLSQEVLDKMHATPNAGYPIATQRTLVDYDAFVFGYPTRFGTLPAQLTEYLGQTGGLWAEGALHGKPVALFTAVSSASGGQEITLRNFLSYVAHHGLIYIPLGYGPAFKDLTNMDEVHGGSPYGAATFAGIDGSRRPSDLEKRIAHIQGETFALSASRFVVSDPASEPAAKTAEPAEALEKATEVHREKSTDRPVQKTRAAQSKLTVQHKEKTGCAKCTIM